MNHLFPLSLTAVLFVLLALPEATVAQRRSSPENTKKILQRIDRNNDGYLMPDEMPGQTGAFVQRLGFDPKNRVRLKDVYRKIGVQDNKGNKSANAKPGEKLRKVPGFGLDATEREGIPGFGLGATVDLYQKYSQSVMEQADSTLSRYDKNKDQHLDRNEQKNANWGAPPPSQNDLNRDGRLSKAELAKRYFDREEAAKRAALAQQKLQQKKALEKSRAARNRANSRSRKATQPQQQSSSSSKSSASSDRFARYADGLMKQYDKDKNGKIDKKELKKMRRPPEGADTDKDGNITRAELLAAVSGTSQPTKSGSAKKTSSKRRSGSSGSFSDRDENGDGQIQMSEYEDDWDGDKLAEFNRIDADGNGIISSAEWSAN